MRVGCMLGACAMLLLAACATPRGAFPTTDVTRGVPPPITPVAIGKRARAVVVAGSPLAGDLLVQVEPGEAEVSREGRVRCRRSDARPGAWQPARVAQPREPWLYFHVSYRLACPRHDQTPDGRIDLELSEVCVRDACEVLRFDISSAEPSNYESWPEPGD